MLEREVESYLVKTVKNLGGKAYKFVSPGNAGVPDRLVVLQNGQVAFVELKSNKGQTTALQEMRLRELKELGCKTAVVHSKEEVDQFLKDFQEVYGL